MPRLPEDAPSAWETHEDQNGDRTRGEALLAARALGRSGFACLDCHAIAGAGLRPGPDLAGASSRGSLWSGATTQVSVAVGLCVERYLDRPALESAPRADLVAALRALPPGATPLAPPAPASLPELRADPAAGGDRTRGLAVYDAACRHCHEDGPAGPALGGPFSALQVARTIRGLDRPDHPATHMPRFESTRLDDNALADVVLAVVESPASATQRPVGSGDAR
jgi:mono/diheme cytochrome c family protein